jgi:hypothetical protein
MAQHSTRITSSDQVVQWLKTQCQYVRLDYQDGGHMEYVLEFGRSDHRALYTCKDGEYMFIAKFIDPADNIFGKEWKFESQEEMAKAFQEVMDYVIKYCEYCRHDNYYYSD